MPKEQQIMNTNGQPVAYTFQFEHATPRLAVKAYDADTPANVYYLRYINEPEQSVNIRFPVTPKNLCVEFVTDNPFSITQTLKGPCTPRYFNVEYERAPEVKRSFGIEDVRVECVDHFEGVYKQTPCYICVEGPDAGLLRVSLAAKAVIPQQQFAFCINHEYKHVFFDTEKYTDEAAFYSYMQQGYNISQAFFALVHILGRNAESVERMISMFKLTRNFNEYYN